jgi:23S rRNA pseudouridine1911/1915/1917 synthase
MINSEEDSPGERLWLTVTEEEAGQRLDTLLANRFQNIHSRTYFEQLIADGNVLLNGAPVKKRIKPRVDDEIEVTFVLSPELRLDPEPTPLDILFEDAHVLVVNKPPGMVVHPAPGNWSGTFVNALLYHCQALEASGESFRPGIVHRLDKETSGVLIAAKTVLAHQRLVHAFSQRRVRKEYLAICVGNPGEGVVAAAIGRHPQQRKLMAVVTEGGRHAETRYRTLAVSEDLSLVRLELITGRTHQARVHMRHRGTPVLGDPSYGSERANQRYKLERQMLHAERVELAHPMTGTPMTWVAPLPADMKTLVATRFRSILEF